MSRRRNIRRAGGGGGGSAATGGMDYREILGPNLIAMWHSQLGIGLVGGAVDTWTDQIGGRVMSAPTAPRRPTYAADGVLFGGKPVVQCDQATQTALVAGGLSGFIAVGAKPWCITRSRARAAITGGAQFNIGSTADAFLQIVETATNTTLQSTFVGTTTGPLKDTNAHTRSYGFDGVNQVLDVDGSVSNLAYAGGIGGALDVTRVAVGCIAWSTTGTDANSNESAAAFLICAVRPTDAQLAAVKALLAAEFP